MPKGSQCEPQSVTGTVLGGVSWIRCAEILVRLVNNEEVSMETRIAKKSRFQIVKLEELVAPTVFATAHASAYAMWDVIVPWLSLRPAQTLAQLLWQQCLCCKLLTRCGS